MQTHVEPTDTSILEFVALTAGNQLFCIEIKQIRELRRWSPVTALPHSTQDVLGVINLRGAVIPIIDLAARFGLPAIERDERNVIVIVACEGQTFGLLVQSVSEILTVQADQIQETPDVQSEATRRSVTGVFAVKDDLIRILDLKAVFQTEVMETT